MCFRTRFCSIGAREMLQSSSPEAGESVEKSMKSLNFDDISEIFEHFGGMEAPSGQSCKKRKLSLHFGDILAAFWRHFFNVFLGILPEGLFAVMGAILCHFGAQNGVKSVPKSIFLEKCRHAFGSSRLDRIACRASPDRSQNPEKTC